MSPAPGPGSPDAEVGEIIPAAVADLVRDADWITVFSGAGMSADSGIATFRDAQTGLWETFDPSELATPEAWERDPALVWGWYRWRAREVLTAEPNAGHRALAELGSSRTVMVVTQNVDDLHERAGSNVVSHLHGSLFAPRCADCGTPYDGPEAHPTPADPDTEHIEPRVTPPTCPRCGGRVRPGVVWFGEALPADDWQRADQAFRAAEVVLVVGTSGIVYPAASLPERAARQGIPVIEFNPAESAVTSIATHSLRVSAAVGLPALLRAIG
ncbi:SIR2 family NAD-dependent protein deacylase [Gordonia paraffinivorans]|uniref:NAD-dependent protein deacylase n=1 Tax=Gordonia paraffinivorans TaxID=175628 RepID=A0ABD7UX80_9ACTN|nr:NAD-dependent deacylase [Gordonia paraffinivorans]VFA80936.1 NAD-dependent deacetylase [Gordonia paraffinivorans]